MAAADTVVGIVGALVLVGAMVGVFIYEYNNVEEADPQVLPGIDEDGDLDGDGVPNGEDTDIDGDGVPDDRDDEIAVQGSASGQLGPTVAGTVEPSFTVEILAQPGATYLNATVVYEVAAPDPAPRLPSFQVLLLDAEGETVATGAPTQEGTTVTSFLELEGEIPRDGATYTLRIEEAQGGPGGSFDVGFWVVYG